MSNLNEVLERSKKTENKPVSAVAAVIKDQEVDKTLEQFLASQKASALPLHYKSINSSRSGYSFKNEILRPDRWGNFYPKDEEQKKFFDSLVSAGKMLKEGE